ncbi:hypothetical protein CCACVL1_08713 [Corchorus capsularis]|uniref:Uncharacterized protein n=1 Tax=Corchorus capsularis TaxID=210143 RepID=A0A1R3IZ52_COCAP|nr:hypothetical protein CCACVL1_08713 [Corchorus capsularis]
MRIVGTPETIAGCGIDNRCTC